MSLPELHRKAVAGFDRRVKALEPADWERSTPCTEWNVRDLVNHVVNENMWTPELLGGKTIDEVGDRFDGDLLGDTPKEAWETSAQLATDAVGGVASFDQPVNVSWGQISAEEYVSQLTLDHVVHAWDLGVGAGGDTELEPELVQFALDYAIKTRDLIRGSGVFGDEVDVPQDAPAKTKLLALLGRDASRG